MIILKKGQMLMNEILKVPGLQQDKLNLDNSPEEISKSDELKELENNSNNNDLSQNINSNEESTVLNDNESITDTTISEIESKDSEVSECFALTLTEDRNSQKFKRIAKKVLAYLSKIGLSTSGFIAFKEILSIIFNK